MLKNILEMESISIKDIDITRIIISKCGEHNEDSLCETIKKKIADMSKESCGYCLWSHGNLNPVHTKEFCMESENDVYVFMPLTTSNTTKGKEGEPFKQWKDGNDKEAIPSNMNPVTGGDKSNRAFYFERIYRLEESVDLEKVYPFYYAVNANGTIKEATETLKSSCSNKCLAIKDQQSYEAALNEFEKNGGYENVILIGKLKYPYHVELIR